MRALVHLPLNHGYMHLACLLGLTFRASRDRKKEVSGCAATITEASS